MNNLMAETLDIMAETLDKFFKKILPPRNTPFNDDLLDEFFRGNKHKDCCIKHKEQRNEKNNSIRVKEKPDQ